MEEITMIELLNKISKGEELPQKIKYFNNIWNVKIYPDGYISYKNVVSGSDLFAPYIRESLNEKIEIIEEEQKNE